MGPDEDQDWEDGRVVNACLTALTTGTVRLCVVRCALTGSPAARVQTTPLPGASKVPTAPSSFQRLPMGG